MEIQDVPETCSDQRMHVLDSGCWCEPTVECADDDEVIHHHVR